VEAVSELRAALATDPDPDLRAIAARWATGVDDTELRDALVQVAVYAAPHLETKLRSQAHRQFDHVVATDNLKGTPSVPPAAGQRPNQSPKWQSRARMLGALNQIYERKIHIPGHGYKKFRTCTADDLFATGASLRTHAKHVTGKADYYERVAARMLDLGCDTVEDLPPEELTGS
jgi:hypothetical protein